MYANKIKFNTGSLFLGLILFVLLIFGFFYASAALYNFLSKIAFILLFSSLVFNYETAVNHFKGLFFKIKENPIAGIINLTLQAFLFPFVIVYIFWKSINESNWLFPRKVENPTNKRHNDDYVEYEEIFNSSDETNK